MAELDGKVAVITGGASGIGERSVRLFVEEGARVVIADMQVERGQALAKELGDVAVFAEVEVRQEDQVKAAVDLATSNWGRLDCIFNNAGFGGVLGPIEDTPVDEFDMTYDVLVRGVFLGMKYAAPVMKKQQSGSIINTGSIAGLHSGYSPHAYAGAKSAVIHMSKSVAMELGEHNIRVNAICPGFIATPLAANSVGKSDDLVDRVKPMFEKSQAIPRAGIPDDIAQMACWLAGNRSTFVTGQAMVVDGGLTNGLKWEDQPNFQKEYHPIKVYRPK
ncbi:MAG: 2,5-dichloro-2,5-cyclohexadiene-1,4-diol dehydrogenase [Gammaproteobacteria bacterium]|nr:MAG: 2,5-dichloro-2,5-cyclohexadiene-1,4-diol dehydrogenase [Gammaproteobacteria bacterium]RLA51249.1 MAG: 2,5-dichloro-2,5-cyclohexadiene-1,4-diol dehydrogenase [Gammaproteobacteria bacterium]